MNTKAQFNEKINHEINPFTAKAKRTFDLVFTIFALVLTLPLFPFIALAIKVDSRGPVFF